MTSSYMPLYDIDAGNHTAKGRSLWGTPPPDMSSESHALPVSPSNNPHFTGIDCLRALGCMAVTTYHLIVEFHKVAGSGFWIFNLLGEKGSGFQGFLVFFIISGYIMPNSFRGERIPTLKRFGISRFFRIYPSFLIVLILGSLAKYGTLNDSRFLYGLTLFPSALGVGVVFGQFWALEVTVFSYVLVSMLFLLFGKLRMRVLFPMYVFFLYLSFSGGKLPRTGKTWQEVPLFLSLFFFGACLREVMKFRPSRLRFSYRSIGIGFVSGLIILLPIYNIVIGISLGEEERVRQFCFYGLWIIVFLFGAILTPLKSVFLARLGRSSYSTYIWHMVLVDGVIISIKSGATGFLAGWPLPYYVVVMLIISLAFGHFAYRWVEQPIGRLGKAIAARSISGELGH